MLKPTHTTSKTIEAAGKKATITVTCYEGKVRDRDHVTLKFLGWKKVKRIGAKCDLYPKCEWYPYVDWGTRTISGSMEGWEAREPEFPAVEKVVQEMLFEAAGWPLN